MNTDTSELTEKIKVHTDAIAKHRDELRKIKEELEGLDESLTEAVFQLEAATDTLSQLL